MTQLTRWWVWSERSEPGARSPKILFIWMMDGWVVLCDDGISSVIRWLIVFMAMMFSH